ncbi:MAG: TM2 domain-containing protein [Flavobacteriaceae bacterium]|nr:TM2 domain-containing protein [Flavobacteriaceae bacterium]
MSEENTNEENDSLKDKVNDAGENAENTAESTAETIKEEAKDTIDQMKEGWNEATKSGENKKLMAGILAIIVGGFGVHKFILGYNKEGFILLGTLIISIPLMCIIIGAFTMYIPIIIGIIEGIIYLTKSDEEFYQTYQVGKKPWF